MALQIFWITYIFFTSLENIFLEVCGTIQQK